MDNSLPAYIHPEYLRRKFIRKRILITGKVI